MLFWDFIRDIFSKKNSEEPRNQRFFEHRDYHDKDSFRNPIWQNDENDDDIDDFRHSKWGTHFHVFSDPLEMSKYFEAQMDHILKSFIFGFGNKDPSTFMDMTPFTFPQNENLRDKMLKPSNDNFNQMEQKMDIDLDGEINADNFSNTWDKYSKPQPQQQRVIGKSIIKEHVHRSDGTIEQKQVFRDNEGNKEVTVTIQNGDKIYTVITKIDKNGVETKTENFVNMDESDLEDKRWLPSIKSNNSHNSNLNYFPWEKFFKPDPKL